MKVIKHETPLESMLISSTVTETEYPAYSAGTTYSSGAFVIYQHNIYQSLQNSNTGHTPSTSTDWWLYAGPTNRWACFDAAYGTSTTSSSDITMVLKVGVIDSISMLNLYGSEVQITVKDYTGGSVVYNKTISLDGSIITSVFDWMYSDYEVKTSVVLLDIPSWYPECEVTVLIKKLNSTASIGVLSLSTALDLGGTQYGAQAGITDYSKKSTDTFGRTTFAQGKFARIIDVKTMFDNADLTKVYRRLSELRTTPCTWLTTDYEQYSELTVFGIFKNFTIDISYPSMNYCNLSIEGLI